MHVIDTLTCSVTRVPFLLMFSKHMLIMLQISFVICSSESRYLYSYSDDYNFRTVIRLKCLFQTLSSSS